MRYWFSRFAFSFIIVAAVVAWAGYQAGRDGAGPWRVNLHYAAAALLFGTGLAALRERHRR
jgi:hypothetical protein